MRPTTASVTVIVPGLNVISMIVRCLQAIKASDYPVREILFFDDGSSDGSGAAAAREGARVLRNDGRPVGPAAGRNRAAAQAQGDLLLFVDSDVVIRPDTIGLLVGALDDGAVAAFGSYDDNPPAPNLASRYANLRHHFVHQKGAGDMSTFWAGIGVIRKDIFLAVGGFSGRYTRPSIEDIELGARLVAQGYRIRLEPRAMGTHLKGWSLLRLWRTDIFARAIPWARLIAAGATKGADLNGTMRERLTAIVAHLLLLGLALAPFWHWGVALALVALVLFLAAIGPFALLLARKLPAWKLPGAIGLHWLYYLYASQILGWTLVAQRLAGKRASSQASRASAR